jgi:hypothetical protein
MSKLLDTHFWYMVECSHGHPPHVVMPPLTVAHTSSSLWAYSHELHQVATSRLAELSPRWRATWSVGPWTVLILGWQARNAPVNIHRDTTKLYSLYSNFTWAKKYYCIHRVASSRPCWNNIYFEWHIIFPIDQNQ